jgi:hypothetical protein
MALGVNMARLSATLLVCFLSLYTFARITTCTLIDHVSYKFAGKQVTSIAEVVKEFNFPK